MKTSVFASAVGGAAAALVAGVMWTAPSASADSDYCNSLPTAAQIHDCSCGFDNVPGSQEYKDCLHAAVAPARPGTPPPAAAAPPAPAAPPVAPEPPEPPN